MSQRECHKGALVGEKANEEQMETWRQVGILPLSKWWTTPSAQAAIARSKADTDRKIKLMLEKVSERKKKLIEEVENCK